MILNGDPAVIYVGEDQFLQRLQSYVQLAPALRQRVPDIDYVDLRFDERIYVRPGKPGAGHGAGAPSRAAQAHGDEAAQTAGRRPGGMSGA